MTITISNIPAGYQLVQTAHSVAEFAHQYPDSFKDWKENSNYIISLSVDNEQKLLKYYDMISKMTDCSIFFEPDINSYTSICLMGTSDVRKKLSHLPLSLKNK